jgi:hypothetical protein
LPKPGASSRPTTVEATNIDIDSTEEGPYSGVWSSLLFFTLAMAAARAETPAAAPLAEVNDEAVTAQDLEQRLVQLEDQIYDLKRRELDALIAKRLLAHEVAKRGIAVSALIDAEVTAKVHHPLPSRRSTRSTRQTRRAYAAMRAKRASRFGATCTSQNWPPHGARSLSTRCVPGPRSWYDSRRLRWYEWTSTPRARQFPGLRRRR